MVRRAGLIVMLLLLVACGGTRPQPVDLSALNGTWLGEDRASYDLTFDPLNPSVITMSRDPFTQQPNAVFKIPILPDDRSFVLKRVDSDADSILVVIEDDETLRLEQIRMPPLVLTKAPS